MRLLILILTLLPAAAFGTRDCEWMNVRLIKADVSAFTSKPRCSNANYCSGAMLCPDENDTLIQKDVICPAMANLECPARYCNDNDLTSTLELPTNAASIQVFAPPARRAGGTR